ncbi:unnamed protein product [Natator depressus]
MNKSVSEQEVTDRGVYNEVVSLLAHTDDQDKGKIALRIAFIAETKLAIVLTVLLEKLQKDEFLRTSLEMIDDSAWSSQISLELSWQMARCQPLQREDSFLYKVLGTSLAACQDLVHVKSQIHTLLTTADYMEVPERQGVVSILAVCAESHLDLTLKARQEFGAAMSKVKISGFISRLKDYHHGARGKTRRTLMLTYSNVAVHAPKEQLLSRVEADITGNVLHHDRTSCQVLGITVTNKDMHLKLTLIQNATELSCAILETRDSQKFKFSYKLELLGCMLMTSLKKEPLESLASPVRYKAILAIRHLSKLKPSLTLKENRDLLHQCFRSLFPLPPLEKMMKEEGETAKDALPIQSLYVESLEALGKLMKTLLEEEPTTHWFQEMFQLLETWLSSEKEWERERALQATIQLLTTYQETVHSTLLSIKALESVLFKGGNERLVRALRKQRTWILLENPKTHHEGVCLLVSLLLRSGLITPEIIQRLLPWVNSPTENHRVTSTAFLAQLMSDPMLREKKFLKPVLHILEERSHDRNSIVRQMAVRGLGNLVYGAPEKVKKHKKFLMVILIRALSDPFSSEVIGESMKAVAKVLKELKEKDIGSSFRDLTQQIHTYFDNEDDALRLLSFVLFGILAHLTKRKWKGYFADQVRQSWVTLLLHLQDPSPRVSVECRATFHLCVPFLGLKRLQTAVNEHLDGTAKLKPEELQVDICRHLAKENAELLENLYKSTITYFCSSWEEIRAVAAKLAGIILEHTDRQRMKWLDLEHLLMSLQVLKKDPSPSVQLVATEVISDICPGRVLGE